jgi:hypothetical protein
MFFRLAVAGPVLAAGLAVAGPAAASVTYDPEAKTGFVGKGDVRRAFGWSDAMLAARASGVVFGHGFWTDDTYAVSCGRAAFPVVHHRDYGRFELAGTVVHDARRDAAGGYGGKLLGFRLAGARFGISGTSVPPTAGQPCPEDEGQAPGSTIDRVRLVSSSSGWTLTVSSGSVQRELLTSAAQSRSAGSGAGGTAAAQ